VSDAQNGAIPGKQDEAAVMTRRTMGAPGVAVLAGLLLGAAPLSLAQAQSPAAQPPLGAQPKGQPKPAAQAQKPAAAAKPPAEAAAEPAARPDASAQLRQRVDQLEEQLVDMQVAVGTLESFAKGGASRATSSPAAGTTGGAGLGGDAGMRLDGMETKMRALASQIEQLTLQMRALEARLGDGAPAGRPAHERGELPPPGPAGGAVKAAGAAAGVRTGAAAAAQPGSPDAIGSIIRTPQPERQPDPSPPVQSTDDARQQPASLTAGNPRELYERAYGHLLQQDYASAEVAFGEFLRQHPNHELSGNAQYWLGESHYVRGQYRPAANAFLKGYQTYGRSQKAPDSLLKLGMSLDRLGQKDAACSSLGELSQRYPGAPAHIQSRAQTERARIGC
jgi:tol-pal system protein YbgF